MESASKIDGAGVDREKDRRGGRRGAELRASLDRPAPFGATAEYLLHDGRKGVTHRRAQMADDRIRRIALNQACGRQSRGTDLEALGKLEGGNRATAATQRFAAEVPVT